VDWCLLEIPNPTFNLINDVEKGNIFHVRIGNVLRNKHPNSLKIEREVTRHLDN
jgi:hypothetical protein